MRNACLASLAVVLITGCNRTPLPNPGSQDTVEKTPSGDTEVKLPPDSPQLRRLKIAEVQTARVSLDEVVAPGRIEANPNRISRVAMPVAGRVRRVMVALGDAVREGDPLFSIESPDAGTATSNYQQARARVVETKASLAKADADLSRSKDLLQGRAIAQKDVLSAEAAVAQARSALEQAQAALEESVARLKIFDIHAGETNPSILVHAPLSGKVLEVSVAAGEYRNDTSAPLMTIADLSTVFMTADVPESQIRLITRGESVKITLSAYPGEVFSGTVARIADIVNPQTRTIEVRALLRNPQGRLRPDMFGEIRHDETYRELPVLPSSAVIQNNDQSIAYREKGAGVFEAIAVRTGKQNGDQIPILSGVTAGDRIVVDGSILLRGIQ